MTSKISFSNLVRSELRQKSWLTALQLLALGLLIPFRLFILLANFRANDLGTNNYSYYVGEFSSRYDLLCKYTGFARPENTVVILILGGVCALCAFGWLHSSVKQDFYHSLALKRHQLFAAKYLTGALTFAGPYVLCQLLSLAIGACYRVLSAEIASEQLLATVQGILFFLCSFSGVLLAVMLTGTFVTTVLAIGVFGLYVPMLRLLILYLKDSFLNTWFGQYDEQAAFLRYSSPWAFCLMQEGTGEGATGSVPGIDQFCQLLAIVVILTLISLALYRIRRTETAGNSLAFPPTEGIIKLMIAVPAGIVAALVANSLFDSALWETVFILLFGSLACMLMELIYRRDFRQMLAHRLHILCALVLSFAVFFAFQYDITGFNTYLPDREDVVSMAVNDSYLLYVHPESGGYYYSYEKSTLDGLETDDPEIVDLIYNLAAEGVANVQEENTEEVDYYYSIKYHTKDGKEIYRIYCAAALFDTMDQLLQYDSFREAYFPILGWSEEQISSCLYVSCELYDWMLIEDIQSTDAVSSDGGEAAESTDSEATDSEDTDSEDTDSEDAGVWGSGNLVTYLDDGSFYTEDFLTLYIPAGRVADVIAAYRKDLVTVSFESLVESINALVIERDSLDEEEALYYRYPITEDFTNTLEVLREINAEENGSGTSQPAG